MHGTARVSAPWRSIGKYISIGFLVASILYLLPHPTTTLPTLFEATGAIGTYTGLLLVIDKDARKLIRDVWQEIRSHFI
jgi:hypothetical protein